MEHAFFHPSRGVWIAIETPSPAILATYPEGTQEIPLPPGPDHQWIDGAWVHTPPAPTTALLEWRAIHEISRPDLTDNLVVMGILTDVEAEDFARGVLPPVIEAWIALLPVEYQAWARRRVAGATSFERGHEMWAMLEAAEGGPAPAIIDEAFGWTGE